jgi:hypothetical protein
MLRNAISQHLEHSIISDVISAPIPLCAYEMAVTLSLLLACALSLTTALAAAGYSWDFAAVPAQCGALVLNITGDGGAPPFRALVIPYGSSPFAQVEVRQLFEVTFNDGKLLSVPLNYPAGSQFVVTVRFLSSRMRRVLTCGCAQVSDANGFGTGGTSAANIVQPSSDSNCFDSRRGSSLYSGHPSIHRIWPSATRPASFGIPVKSRGRSSLAAYTCRLLTRPALVQITAIPRGHPRRERVHDPGRQAHQRVFTRLRHGLQLDCSGQHRHGDSGSRCGRPRLFRRLHPGHGCARVEHCERVLKRLESRLDVRPPRRRCLPHLLEHGDWQPHVECDSKHRSLWRPPCEHARNCGRRD